MRIAILGAGAWGTALAVAFAENHAVTLWSRDAAHLVALRQEGQNRRYLPGQALPANLDFQADLTRLCVQAELAILAVPLVALDETVHQLGQRRNDLPLLWACKGIEAETGRLPHQIVQAHITHHHWGALSGPSFASEVASGLPTALTLAAESASFSHHMVKVLHSPRLRLYSSQDVVGVEVAGALKNVMAIASGLADGLELGFNARAALITRGLAEITRLGMAMGGKQETFMGLAGLGDLVLTCTGPLSRNYQVGQGLSRKIPLETLLQQLGHVAEGVPTTAEALKLARQWGVDMPITETVNALLQGTLTAVHALKQLLARQPRQE